MRNFALLISLIFSLNVTSQIDNIAEKLGYNRDAKLLIIHGDDIGVSHSVNIASFDGYKNNAINSGSAMIPSPWIKEVAAFHKKNPNYDIGLHLTLTAEWKNYKWDGVSSSNEITSLLNTDFEFYDKTALIYGAGGSARAIASALISNGIKEVGITNRTRAKAQIISENLGAKAIVVDWRSAPEMVTNADIIINATSMGMIGQPVFSQPISRAKKTALVVDIVYNPMVTDLLKEAKRLKLKTVGGIGMLINQAVPAFEHWFQKKPIIDDEIKRFLIE